MSSTSSFTSGWNCRPSERPVQKAWSAAAVRLSTAAVGGVVNRSKCQENHGPGSISPDGSSETGIHPISGVGAAATDPPSAAASSCPPKQIPSTGTPSETADRANAISSPTQLPIVAVSYTDQAAP